LAREKNETQYSSSVYLRSQQVEHELTTIMRMNIFSFLVHAAQYQTCDMRIPSIIRLITYLVISLEYTTSPR
jgi:hypothetical protein